MLSCPTSSNQTGDHLATQTPMNALEYGILPGEECRSACAPPLALFSHQGSLSATEPLLLWSERAIRMNVSEPVVLTPSSPLWSPLFSPSDLGSFSESVDLVLLSDPVSSPTSSRPTLTAELYHSVFTTLRQ